MNISQLNALSEVRKFTIVKVHGTCGLVSVMWTDTGVISVISKDEVEQLEGV